MSITEQVNRSREYFNTGKTRSYEWRRTQLLALRSLVLENEEEIGRALVKDLGKPRIEWSVSEISMPVTEISATLDNLKSLMAPKSVPTSLALLPASSSIVPEPFGQVLIISPFNYPVQLSLLPLAGALAAGNVCVLKPSELTPHTSAVLSSLLPRYLDPLAVLVFEGAVDVTTTLLSLKWDYIFFTGSENVGRVVMRAAAEHLTPCTMELGGKSPTIVHSDADVPLAARRIMWGKVMNCGQTCVAPDYVYVHESIKAKFLEECKKNLVQFFKDPKNSPDYGRIVNTRHAARLDGIINGHRARNEIAAGGNVDVENRYVEPTIIDLTRRTLNGEADKGKAMEEEIFGPILPVLSYSDIKSVVSYINSRPKPLALYVFSSSSSFQESIVSSTSSGSVCINDVVLQITNPSLPFGGVGSSGHGAYHGKFTFSTFSHFKAVLNKSVYGDAPLRYPPYTRNGLLVMRWIGDIYRVNDESFKKFFKFVLLPAVAVLLVKKYGFAATSNL